ncbi:MAG: GTPase [Burkholderiales bacterium]|nr:MAG: GTPase [Burkholderiales bacterium]
MNPEQQDALLTIALMAAFADNRKDDSEREAVRALAASLGQEAALSSLPRLYQDVLLRRVDLARATAALDEPGLRHLAYETAVGICDADGERQSAETEFLVQLRQALKLEGGSAEAVERQETELQEAATWTPSAAVVAAPAAMAAAVPSLSPEAGAQLDKRILNAALLAGALELLPQSWATMAIIPLQLRLVYNVGKAHGIELDQGHVREFVAAAGVGLASQYLEQFGRKLVGGLLGKVAGRTVGGIGRAGAGMAMSFATTYALGQVARRYYGGGRVMSTELLRSTFQDLLGPARQMQASYMPQMQSLAGTLDAGKVTQLLRSAG